MKKNVQLKIMMIFSFLFLSNSVFSQEEVYEYYNVEDSTYTLKFWEVDSLITVYQESFALEAEVTLLKRSLDTYSILDSLSVAQRVLIDKQELLLQSKKQELLNKTQEANTLEGLYKQSLKLNNGADEVVEDLKKEVSKERFKKKIFRNTTVVTLIVAITQGVILYIISL